MKVMLDEKHLASNKPFNKTFEIGFTHYVRGNWQAASEFMKKCQLLKPQDGPTAVIVNHINSYDLDPNKADWKGYRVL
jgi:hypothetical protein